MKQFPFLALFLLISLCAYASSAKGKQGRSKDGKGRRPGRFSVAAISTCMGQPIDLTSQLEAYVEECLDSRVQEIQEAREEEGAVKRKAEKKRAKKKEKLEKMMRRKCLRECEWKTFDLIPEMNDTETGSVSSIYPAVEIPESFLSAFPKDAQMSLKNRMEACYNRTSPLPLKEGKKKMKLGKMCKKNIRLMKCLGKTLRQTCNGKASILPTNGSDDATPAAKSGLENNVSTSPSPEDIGDDEEDDDVADDDVDEDDDEEDEEETTTGISVTAKVSTPGSHVDTSQPITK